MWGVPKNNKRFALSKENLTRNVVKYQIFFFEFFDGVFLDLRLVKG